MNFDFSDDEKHLREEAHRFLRDQCPMTSVRSVLENQSDHDADLWTKIAGMGWTSITIPEAYGGLGLSQLDLCVIAEELGRALAPLPTVASIYMGTDAVVRLGSEKQKRDWLPRLAQGETIATVAWSEAPGLTPPHQQTTRFADGVISGIKRPVSAGMSANLAIVSARNAHGSGLYLVDLTHAGVTRERIDSIDPTRGHAALRFADVPAEPLGHGDAGTLLDEILVRAAVPTAFEQVAGAESALEAGRGYALERFAFGRQIGSFQAIKHKLADMFVAAQLARSNAYYAAWALSRGDSELPMASACARVSACRAFDFTAQENLHIHGGVGYTWEVDCHLYYRRARELSLVLGSPRAWKERVASGLEARRSGQRVAA
jgi:acyl-CoA dehydrogenase